MFDYDPIEAKRTIDKGVYEAILEGVSEKNSRAGKPMLELTFDIFGPRQISLRDYIVKGSGIWKLEQLATAFGVHDDFTARRFDPADYIGRRVQVALVVKDSDKYGEQNSISAYARSEGAEIPAPASMAAEAVDESLPF